jgi:hypothetical protein
LKVKLKSRHSDTTEVIKAELQAVLNTLPEYDFQEAFKNAKTVQTGGRGLFRGSWWPVGPMLVFDQTAAPVPEIMDVWW